MTVTLSSLQRAIGDKYSVERELGRGGMAAVYLAEDRRHSRKVAVKVLHTAMGKSIGAERFLREIRIIAALSHPNILPLHDSGSADGQPYYVMPFIEGETLRARLDRGGRLPVREAVRIGSEVADALDYAHRQGVVHRDVKPDNILLADGHAVIADFGIAHAVREGGTDEERLTWTGVMLGTPKYMSPEQATGERRVHASSDIFSLGCVMYEMLAGESPFAAPTMRRTIARVLGEPASPLRQRRPEAGAALERVIETSLAKEPSARFATAREFAQALDESVGRAASLREALSRIWQSWRS